jgi:hypothetical protein
MILSDLSFRGAYQESNGILSTLIPYFHRIKHDSCGIINLGLAENMLCEQELVTKLSSLQIWSPPLSHYGDPLR